MELIEAAKLLRQRIAIPEGMLSVWSWHGDNKSSLIVRVDPRYKGDLSCIPKEFGGYEVIVQEREIPEAG